MNAQQSWPTCHQRGRLSVTLTTTPERTNGGRALLADAFRHWGEATGGAARPDCDEYALATVSGRPVGIVGITHGRGNLAELSPVYVRPFARALAMTTEIVHVAVGAAQRHGATRIVTTPDVAPALRYAS